MLRQSETGEAARPFNLVMADRRGLDVDVHGVVFDAAGNGLYGPQPADGSGRFYPAAAFTGAGTIGGESVRCMSVEYQVVNHAAYDPGEADFHDIYSLHDKFGIDLPDEYARPTDKGG